MTSRDRLPIGALLLWPLVLGRTIVLVIAAALAVVG